MKEIKIKLNFMEWYVTPEIKKANREIKIKFLFLDIYALKNKKQWQK